MKKLGGISFGYNMESQDYNWRETINCLSELCDHVVILDAGSTDGSDNLLEEYCKPITNVQTVLLPNFEWENQQGQQKLAYFQNIALSFLNKEYEYYFLLQLDEIIHQDSFPYIREAMEANYEGYLCRRFNLWGNADHYLSVSPDRMPVSDYVIRLARTAYQSYGDGESIQCPANIFYKELIEIWHYGFVRDTTKQVVKMKNMQEKIFGWGLDQRQQGKDVFNPWDYFTPADVVPTKKSHPKFIKQWCKEREHHFKLF